MCTGQCVVEGRMANVLPGRAGSSANTTGQYHHMIVLGQRLEVNYIGSMGQAVSSTHRTKRSGLRNKRAFTSHVAIPICWDRRTGPERRTYFLFLRPSRCKLCSEQQPFTSTHSFHTRHKLDLSLHLAVPPVNTDLTKLNVDQGRLRLVTGYLDYKATRRMQKLIRVDDCSACMPTVEQDRAPSTLGRTASQLTLGRLRNWTTCKGHV